MRSTEWLMSIRKRGPQPPQEVPRLEACSPVHCALRNRRRRCGGAHGRHGEPRAGRKVWSPARLAWTRVLSAARHSSSGATRSSLAFEPMRQEPDRASANRRSYEAQAARLVLSEFVRLSALVIVAVGASAQLGGSLSLSASSPTSLPPRVSCSAAARRVGDPHTRRRPCPEQRRCSSVHGDGRVVRKIGQSSPARRRGTEQIAGRVPVSRAA